MTRKSLLHTLVAGLLASLGVFTALAGLHAQAYLSDDDVDGPAWMSEKDVERTMTRFAGLQVTLKEYAAKGVDLSEVIEAPAILDDANEVHHPDIVEIIEATSAATPNDDTAQYSVVRQRTYRYLTTMEVWNAVNQKGGDGQIHQIAKLNLAQSSLQYRFKPGAPVAGISYSYLDLANENLQDWHASYKAHKTPALRASMMGMIDDINLNDFTVRDPSTLDTAQVLTQYVHPAAHGNILNKIVGIFYGATCSNQFLRQELGPNGPYAHGSHQISYQCRNGTVRFTDQGQTVLTFNDAQP